LAAGLSVFGLGADVITGFPGETEADHAETLALVDRLPFTYLHVFPYSPRPTTAAERLPHPVSPTIAQARAAELRDLGARKAAAYQASRVGGLADVIAIGSAERREGLTGDYLSVLPVGASIPRGARFSARLAEGSPFLEAHPVA
jgi:threonylcarbamoyladenosine tRNA methylthiotransferase MtaB